MMLRQFTCIALLFAVSVSAYFGPSRRPWTYPRPGWNGNRDRWLSNLCANETVAQTFFAQTIELFDLLQSNGSFTRFLEDRSQTIAYIRNSDNLALLSSNCTAYISGLKDARDADRAEAQVEREYYQSAAKAMIQIIRNLFGFSSAKDDD